MQHYLYRNAKLVAASVMLIGLCTSFAHAQAQPKPLTAAEIDRLAELPLAERIRLWCPAPSFTVNGSGSTSDAADEQAYDRARHYARGRCEKGSVRCWPFEASTKYLFGEEISASVIMCCTCKPVAAVQAAPLP